MRVFAIYQILLGWETYTGKILWNRQTPQSKANPTLEKIG